MKYSLAYSPRRKTLGLQVKRGEVIVRAPVGVSERQIEAFVRSRRSWIERHLSEQQQVREQYEVRICQQGRVPLAGQWLRLDWYSGASSAVEKVDSEQALQVRLSRRICRPEPEVVREQLYRWFREQAETELMRRLELCVAETGLVPALSYIGHWRGRWGQCSSTGEVGLNWRLIQLPLRLQDYVIVHELCHLRHMNHGKGFHRLMAHHFPDQRQLAKQMTAYSAWLEW